MARYPYLVQIAWDVIEKFLTDWQVEPFRWSREVDIQAEISSRLSSVYRNIGRDTVVGNYKDTIPGFERDQLWSRVCCGHRVYYTHKDGKRYHCHPDIIVWEDLDDPNNPPDVDGYTNWPMLWVCEIKYESGEKGEWDIEKMKYLLAHGDAKYACWLNILRERAESGDGITWEKDERLWICTALLPALEC